MFGMSVARQTLISERLYTKEKMKTLQNHELIERDRHQALDATIRVGDTVHLKLADGTAVKSVVIFDAPITGTVIYTADSPDRGGLRARFRESAVHAVESLCAPRYGNCW